MLSSQLVWILAVTAALLVEAHGEIKCPALQGPPGPIGPPGPRGPRGTPGFRGSTGLPGLPTSEVIKLQNDVKDHQRRISRMEKALTFEGKMLIAGDKVFASTGKPSDFVAAEATCKEAQGAIAEPRNLKENQAIQQIVQFYNSYAYLGIIESDVPGKFHFQNGDPLNFTNWYKNEPSSPGIEKCVEMYSDGTWNDKMCDNDRLVICQL